MIARRRVQSRKNSTRGQIAFAGGVFQPRAIEYSNFASRIFDQAPLLQRSGNRADSRALAPDHLTQEFLWRCKHRVARPVLNHKKPAGQPRLNVVEAIAACYLSEKDRLVLVNGYGTE